MNVNRPGKRKARNTWLFGVVGVVLLVLVAIVVWLGPGGPALYRFIRVAALLGYSTVFLSILSSAYLRELVQLFGRPFIRVHHVISVTGLIVITAHPIAVAWQSGTLAVFVPKVSSLAGFLDWGGSVAWYLIGLAAVAALVRKSLKRSWRIIHYVNYLAFVLATVHAIRLGADVQQTYLMIITIVMALAVVAVFAQKRISKRRKKPASR